MKIVFFGTPEIAAECLEFLIQHSVEIVAVVTKPDKPKGRSGTPQPSQVKSLAERLIPHIPLLQPDHISDVGAADSLKTLQPDLFVIVAFGEILKKHVLEIPKKGSINLHTSLLPKFRGAAPIQRAIMEGDKKTGITVIDVVQKMDAGDMLKQIEVPILPDMTSGELEKALGLVGKQALYTVIKEIENGTVIRTAQDHAKMTLAHKIELEDCQVFFSNPAQKLHDLIRGVNPHPGAWCTVRIRDQLKRMKVFATKVVPDLKGNPGEILQYDQNGLVIGCEEGALSLIEVQLEGKKKMSGQDFVRGHQKINVLFTK